MTVGVHVAVLPGGLSDLLGGPHILATTVPDALVFSVAALMVLAGAVGVIVARNPVHSALMLVLTLFGVAVEMVAQDAQFLAAVQVIVYAGAIVVLFLFVITLLGVDNPENLKADALRLQRPMAIVLGVAATVGMLLLGWGASWATGARSLSGKARGQGSNVGALGKVVFTTYLLPFEATSLLLVIAVVGAVILVRHHGSSGSAEPEAGDGTADPEVGPVPAGRLMAADQASSAAQELVQGREGNDDNGGQDGGEPAS